MRKSEITFIFTRTIGDEVLTMHEITRYAWNTHALAYAKLWLKKYIEQHPDSPYLVHYEIKDFVTHKVLARGNELTIA